ncbi:hypothetical protein, partial [Paenibacillus sp. 453mf]|uniref:hypothetical protein n=1 Tax=Paenibacillus sp. 453mf TaxID=1761874 RepID=UPI001BA5A40D
SFVYSRKYTNARQVPGALRAEALATGTRLLPSLRTRSARSIAPLAPSHTPSTAPFILCLFRKYRAPDTHQERPRAEA